ncbi:hypothetical protein NCAS_0E00950 [Naumovozyma castellii]|uniref:STAS domain-containing protein n=1 Tax=Naumovozyma castellii TaxID=27288 RepID=G0VFA0_NAUCA|nr:hypothetical protein NCAS_0E00950 [Naumovozyma castellii CBS 4309]CCC70165.1 hypothetical protein NCAS_0E00950 [Naumovozyma castellii CBS 4309]
MSHRNSIDFKKKNKQQSISGSISVSLGLQQEEEPRDDYFDDENVNNNNYMGRSYVSGFLSVSPALMGSMKQDEESLPMAYNGGQRLFNRPIHASEKLHKQTAAISEDFEDDEDDTRIKDYITLFQGEDNGLMADKNDSLDQRLGLGQDEEAEEDFIEPVAEAADVDESSRLLISPLSSNINPNIDDLLPTVTGEDVSSYQSIYRTATPSLSRNSETIWQNIADFPYQFIHYLPAAVLGLLLNILDALSYGMIIFPITEPIFSHLGPTGLSMFYISTIISQTIYSSGWSSFPSGIGSEMIEVTPFFHTMALAIKETLPGRDDEIITTTIFCYVISSMLTGLTFYSLGKLHLGKIVGFFPRHILIGCIGGVGYFLLVTGIEVTTRVAKFEYSIPFLASLFSDWATLWKWLLPVLLTVILIVTQRCFKNSLVLPSFYILTLILFHFIVAIIPSLTLNQLRDSGWIFPIAISNSKWYDHYKLFDFKKVHWTLVFKQIPTMLALTFFGILHVPINVPALAMSLHLDKYDVDKELIAHGLSNFISGAVGSIQNYLVYTNSVLFIRAGADSAMAGYILIILTAIVMFIGPVIISFIPICIVGSLIFLLGYELLVEALWDPWGKISNFEYITIVIIVLTMGIFDFVLGIIVGILIACFSFLIDSTKLQTINGEYDGTVAKSTVYRDLIQTKFLNGIGEQIYVLKLQNLLFFGTIISIEEKIDELLEICHKDSSRLRIKYLILDFKNINADNIDYSAAEGFNRIKRFTQTKKIQLLISSIKERDHIYKAFDNVGLLKGVELFNDLNSALEWCENEFLFKYKQLRDKAKSRLHRKQIIDINASIGSQKYQFTAGNDKKSNLDIPRNLMSLPINTPRNHQILSVAQNVFQNEEQTVKNLKTELKDQAPFLPLLLFTLKQYRPGIISTDKTVKENEIKFWSQLCPYFVKLPLASQSTLIHNNNIFFIVETGILKATFNLPQGNIYETMSNRTCYGKITGQHNESTLKTLTIRAEIDSILWVIDSGSLIKMRAENAELFTELTLLIMAVKDNRFKELLGYTLVSA